MSEISIQIKQLDPRVSFPGYESADAAGVDLRACLDEPLQISPNQVILIPTGLAIHIANPFVAGLILPRSGLGHKKGIVLGNLTGLIDPDYQGELKISCWNRSTDHVTIAPFERIAQLVFVPILKAKFESVTEFAPSIRGEQGFGHTGTR